MTAKVGIFRTGTDLDVGGRRAAEAARAQPQHRPALRARAGANPELVDRLSRAEDAEARALRRLRRAHAHREPRRALPRGLPAPQRRAMAEAHARHVEGRARHAADARLRAARREAMELPPGWRGYGAKDYIDHPDTAGAQAEVDALREQRAATAFERQQRARCPTTQLLPRALRGRNERIDEPLAMTNRREPSEPSVRLGKRVTHDRARRHRTSRCRRRHAATGEKIRLQHPALQPARARRALRTCRPTSSSRRDGMTLFIALERDPREARSVAAVRLRLPRRHLRQLRDDDQRPPRARVPHAHARTSAPRSRWRPCRCSS